MIIILNEQVWILEDCGEGFSDTLSCGGGIFLEEIYWHSYSSNVFLSNFDPVTVWFLFGSKKKKNTKKGNLLSNGDTFWSSVEMIVSTICVKCTCTQHEGK